jgi:translation initiation factor 2 gamma subunit (eIF-2gamma)
MQKGNPLAFLLTPFLYIFDRNSEKTHRGIIIALIYASFRFFVCSKKNEKEKQILKAKIQKWRIKNEKNQD